MVIRCDPLHNAGRKVSCYLSFLFSSIECILVDFIARDFSFVIYSLLGDGIVFFALGFASMNILWNRKRSVPF